MLSRVSRSVTATPMLPTTAEHLQDQRWSFPSSPALIFLNNDNLHHYPPPFFRFFPYLHYSCFMLCLSVRVFYLWAFPSPPPCLLVYNIVNLHGLKADEVVGADWEQHLLMSAVTRLFLYLGKDVTMELGEVTVSKPTALLWNMWHRRKHPPVTESPTHRPAQENLLETAKLFPFLMIHANTATDFRGRELEAWIWGGW